MHVYVRMCTCKGNGQFRMTKLDGLDFLELLSNNHLVTPSFPGCESPPQPPSAGAFTSRFSTWGHESQIFVTLSLLPSNTEYMNNPCFHLVICFFNTDKWMRSVERGVNYVLLFSFPALMT